jgi:hypothetical protein
MFRQSRPTQMSLSAAMVIVLLTGCSTTTPTPGATAGPGGVVSHWQGSTLQVEPMGPLRIAVYSWRGPGLTCNDIESRYIDAMRKLGYPAYVNGVDCTKLPTQAVAPAPPVTSIPPQQTATPEQGVNPLQAPRVGNWQTIENSSEPGQETITSCKHTDLVNGQFVCRD